MLNTSKFKISSVGRVKTCNRNIITEIFDLVNGKIDIVPHKSHKTPACPAGVFSRWYVAICGKCGKIKGT
jgi:hypothetical protein